LLFTLAAGAGAQRSSILQEVELVTVEGRERLIVQCDGRIEFVDKYTDEPPSLTLLLPNSLLNLPETNLQFNRKVVKSFVAAQQQTVRPSVRIDILFNQPTGYNVNQSLEGLFYIDFLDKEAVPSGTEGPGVDLIEAFERDLRPQKKSFKPPASISLNNYQGRSAPDALKKKDLISLDVREAEIANVLRLLAKQSNLNIVAGKEVAGKITVSLVKVSTKEALDMVVKANGFDYITEGDVILVKSRESFGESELETKVYHLKYIDAYNVKNAARQVLSPQARMEIFYANFSPVQGAKANTETGDESAPEDRSSILIVTDSPDNIRQLDAMIAALDKPTSQIMIEAKLIEVSPQHEQKLGINWDKTISSEVFREFVLPSGQVYRNAFDAPLADGQINYGTLNLGQYNATLDFLNQHTNAKLVSNPRILARDNEEALISVGTTVPIPQINRGIGGTGDVVTFQYMNVSISLRVTPHVGEDRTITLSVNPIIEEIIGEVRSGTNSAPITSKREVTTVVNLASDETMVIGGLIKENTVERVSKVWMLGDVPLLGNLFRHKEKSKEQTDLLIFITPRLL
jgi:type IV pilus assembly protein PilQ